jgi:hypothetical protein
MKIIGLGHKARQGKDNVAKFMIMELAKQDIYARQYAFADALRDYCRVAYGMKEKNSQMLQIVGTDIFRNSIRENFWIDCLHYKLEADKPQIAIITDVRFPNELRYVCDNGFTVRIDRYTDSGGIRLPYRTTDRDNNHESETALDDFSWDYVIENDGSLEDLKMKVKKFIYSSRIYYSQIMKD